MKKKGVMTRTFVSLGALVWALQAQAGVFADLDTFSDLGSAGISQALYLNYGIKINHRYTVTPETLNRIDYKNSAGSKTTISHGYVRVTALDSSLAKMGDWTVQMGYRYVLPTSLSMQKQGAYGAFSFRPTVTRSGNSWSFLARLSPSIYLQRDGRAVVGGASNPLAGIGLEMIPVYNFTDKLSLGADIYVATTYYGVKTPNGKDGAGNAKFTHLSYEVLHNYELSYTVDALGGTAVGVYFEHDSVFGKDAQTFAIMSKAAEFGLSLSRAF